MFKIGQKIIFLDTNHVTRKSQIKEATVTKVGKEAIWLDNEHRGVDQVLPAFCFPDVPDCRELLTEHLSMTARHKKEESEAMRKLYQLNNEMVKLGLK